VRLYKHNGNWYLIHKMIKFRARTLLGLFQLYRTWKRDKEFRNHVMTTEQS